MDNNIINVLLNDLGNERVKLEHELERVINLNIHTDDKILKIKEVLKDIVLNESMIIKWKEYLIPSKNDDNNK